MVKIFLNSLNCVFLWFSLIGFSFFCWAEKARQDALFHPVFLSVSGSGGASFHEDFSYLINPALLIFHKKKKGVLSYSFKGKQQTALLSIVDHKVKIPIALTYQRWWADSFITGAQNKFFFTSGFKILPFLSLGFNVERDLNSSLWNSGLGSFFKLSSQFSVAVFLDKMFIEKKKNLRVFTFAGFYRWKNFFSAQADLSRSARKQWILKAAVKSLFHPVFSVQLGGLAVMEQLNFQKPQKQFISGGLNFHTPYFLLGYGLQTDREEYQHSWSVLIRY